MRLTWCIFPWPQKNCIHFHLDYWVCFFPSGWDSSPKQVTVAVCQYPPWVGRGIARGWWLVGECNILILTLRQLLFSTLVWVCFTLFLLMSWIGFFFLQLHVRINSILSFLTKVLSHRLNLLLFLFSVCLSWIPFTCKPWSIDDLFIGELLPNILWKKKQKSSKLNVHVMP